MEADTPIRKPMLGCIADDVTGATDLAINLVQGGMCVVQMLGVPATEELAEIDADAVVVALKTRSVSKNVAVTQSLEGLAALRRAGVDRYYFKYCSTFDSTEQGNIGPVAAAMMEALDVKQTIFCPAFPRNGRTVYQGHLFVNGRLLNESGMEKHPLNPMTDPNLVRFLRKQTDCEVGLLSYDKLASDSELCQELRQLAGEGSKMVITDACDDQHLARIAHAVTDMRLLTGGSGIARYLPDAYRRIGLLNSVVYEPRLPDVSGRSLILSGSCSTATNQQVTFMRTKCPSQRINVDKIIDDAEGTLAAVVNWAAEANPHEPLLVYSTALPEEVADLQNRHGTVRVTQAIESFLAAIARGLVSDLDVRRLVLAGGETAGAVLNQLGVRSLRIGPEICAGVPWTESIGARPQPFVAIHDSIMPLAFSSYVYPVPVRSKRVRSILVLSSWLSSLVTICVSDIWTT